YGVLYHIAKSWPKMRGGFMHVPFLHEQVMNRPNTASLSSQDIVIGIQAALEAIVSNEKDAAHVMGATH
ncbi:MAG: pyroglutamyl-peptidase I, partial [Clostridiales bacterium]|nr:pyroglutamyl-peptidase I [Clostridiales bacterium]